MRFDETSGRFVSSDEDRRAYLGLPDVLGVDAAQDVMLEAISKIDTRRAELASIESLVFATDYARDVRRFRLERDIKTLERMATSIGVVLSLQIGVQTLFEDGMQQIEDFLRPPDVKE